MLLKDRVVIMTEENMRGLELLYGEMAIEGVSEFVNKHVSVAIDEIMEDENING